jgi:NAD(P)-dependent dehydrogenase (short-subunit alcohol dehydrogenase family)
MTTLRPIIIGGTNGLGLELAKLAAMDDHRTLVMGRQIRPEHRRTILEHMNYWPLDLTSNDSISTALRHLGDAALLDRFSHVVLAAGIGYQGRLTDQSFSSIDGIQAVLVSGPLKFMAGLIRQRGAKPLHLVTISSTTATKVRDNETAYAGGKGGQAQMARGLHQELLRDLPGSKSTLAHPGGMHTDFYLGSDTDTSEFMDPSVVATLIWGQVLSQTSDWLEFSIPRASQPKIVLGTPAVEFPKS